MISVLVIIDGWLGKDTAAGCSKDDKLKPVLVENHGTKF